MRRPLQLLALCALATPALAEPTPEPSSTEVGHALTVRVDGLRNSEGQVQFSLYNEPGSIPDEKFKRTFQQALQPVSDHSAEAVFHDLPPGSYAISIHHDENEDGVINRGFILPIEGVGFTNYTRIGPLNRPSFKGASFELSGDQSQQVSVIYF